jgi:hypothetical protein
MDIICTNGKFQSKTEGYVNWGTFCLIEIMSRRYEPPSVPAKFVAG